MAQTSSAGDKEFAELLGKVFTDPGFAKALEQDPEKALRDAGYQLDQKQLGAIKAGEAKIANVDANVAAFVRPVVSVLTKGTQPAVQVVVSSTVVASKAAGEENP